MAVLLYLGQVPAQWFSEAGDAALAGGVLKFFEVGTSTPKAVYDDYQGLTAAGTTVTLDASGRANVFLSGLYSVQLFDAFGAQIGPTVDCIGDARSLAGSTWTVTNYAGLRALDGDDARAVVVEGRATDGDGGAGLFVWDAASTAADDDGALLRPATLPAAGRWIRASIDSLDPRWYGCKVDGATADDTAWASCQASAVARELPIFISGGLVRLSANTNVSAGVEIRTATGAGFTATTAVDLVFPGTSLFSGSPGCFAGDLQPVFNANTVPTVPLSWMAAANAASRLDKWAACSPFEQNILLDETISTDALPVFPDNLHLDIAGGRITITDEDVDLSVDVLYQGWAQWIEWTAKENIGTVYVGKRPCRAEWFGAVGNATADDALPMFAAMLTGSVELRPDGRYLIDDDISLDGDLRVVGALESAMDWNWTLSSTAASLPSPAILLTDGESEILQTGSAKTWSFRGCSIAVASGNLLGNVNTGSMTFDGCALWCEDDAAFKSDYVTARDCSIAYPGIFFAAADDQHLSNVKSAGLTRTNFRDNTSLRNAYVEADLYLDDNKNAATCDMVLTTDFDGLVTGKTSLVMKSVIEKNKPVTVIQFSRFKNDLDMWIGSVKRNGETVYSDAMTGTLFYEIQASDAPTIIADYSGDATNAAQVIVPKVKPSGSDRITVASITSEDITVGEGPTGDVIWNASGGVPMPGIDGGQVLECVYYGGKWSVG